MHKLTLLLATSLLSFSAFAGTTQMTVTPASPAVIEGDFKSNDGTMVNGPWWGATFTVNTDVAIVINKLSLSVQSAEGQMYSQILEFTPTIELEANHSFSIQRYVGSLPKSSITVYDAKVGFEAMEGTNSHPGQPVFINSAFQTH